MADDKTLKSSYELAMERLRQKDAEAGIDRRPITDAQRAAIAEVRSFYQAKIAGVDVLYESKMRSTFNAEEQATLTDGHRRDRERFEAERDAKIAAIRSKG
jgi:hypothetical protein